jgi:excisionase family DNA binding protein
MNEDLLGAGEAARRLGVSPATIQRWISAGLLTATRTHGGHRRIPLREIRRFLAATKPAPATGNLEKWIEPLLAGDAQALRALVIATRHKSGHWSSVVEEIAAAIAEIGRRWEIGSCLIFEEHAASETLRRVAASCSAEIPCGPDAPPAALLTVAGDRHTLGLSLAELVVVEAGWKPLWLGDGPPADELDLLIEKRRPGVLVVAASSATPQKVMSRYQSALEKAARRRKVALVFAGDGSWTPSKIGQRVYNFHELERILTQCRSASV